jgi:hypothetical protein
MDNEEFLPKWYPSSEPKNKVAESVFAGVLLVLIAIFTLGIVTSLEHTSQATKRRK